MLKVTSAAFALTLILTTVPAYAYVDPGTGSLAIQFVIGGLVAAGFMIKTYYYQLKSKVLRLMGRETSELTDPSDRTQRADVEPAKPE